MSRAGRPLDASAAPPAVPALHPRNVMLIARLQGDLPLSERPFADLGAELGMGEDEVIERLHLLLGQGALTHLGPTFQVEPAAEVALSEIDRALIDATQSGLPLVQRPYEALGAMLGLPSDAVRGHLARLRDQGLMRRIGAVAGDPMEGPAGGPCPP